MLNNVVLRELKGSLVIICQRFFNEDGFDSMRVCGTGFIFEGKYILTSLRTYEFVDSLRHNRSAGLFANVSGENKRLEYIDRDSRRSLCVFGLLESNPINEDEIQKSENEIPPLVAPAEDIPPESDAEKYEDEEYESDEFDGEGGYGDDDGEPSLLPDDFSESFDSATFS
jgi:hypothetical protein